MVAMFNKLFALHFFHSLFALITNVGYPKLYRYFISLFPVIRLYFLSVTLMQNLQHDINNRLG